MSSLVLAEIVQALFAGDRGAVLLARWNREYATRRVWMRTDVLNKGRVADLHRTMSGYVERGDIPGIVTLIACGEEVNV